MKLIAPIYQLNHMENLSKHLDGFLIGNHQFGTRLTHSFNIDEINEAIKKSKVLNKEIFLVCNQIFTDDQLIELKRFISLINTDDLNGIILGDLGALSMLKSQGFNDQLIYNPETLLTNVYDVNFLHQQQIQGVYLAKEITLEDIIYIAKQKKLKLFYVGHGHLNMFYSKRQLIDNFTKYIEIDNNFHDEQNMKIIEETRKDEAYPILEDLAGTHVFRSKVMSSLNQLDILEKWIDYLVIDSIFKDDEYTEKVAYMYKNKILDPIVIENLKKEYQETWDEGFFFKKTIYKQKVKP